MSLLLDTDRRMSPTDVIRYSQDPEAISAACDTLRGQHTRRLQVIHDLGMPDDDFALGNSTASGAHDLLDVLNLPGKETPDLKTIAAMPPDERDLLIAADDDVYVGRESWAHLILTEPMRVRKTVTGEYPVVNPGGDPLIEIFPAFHFPIVGEIFGHEDDIIKTAQPHDFGDGIVLPVTNPDVILAIHDHFQRPQDVARSVLIRNRLAERADATQSGDTSPINVYSTRNSLHKADQPVRSQRTSSVIDLGKLRVPQTPLRLVTSATIYSTRNSLHKADQSIRPQRTSSVATRRVV